MRLSEGRDSAIDVRDVKMIPRAGHSDVEQAGRFRLGFLGGVLGLGGPPVWKEVCHAAEDDRELQTFGTVVGADVHARNGGRC